MARRSLQHPLFAFFFFLIAAAGPRAEAAEFTVTPQFDLQSVIDAALAHPDPVDTIFANSGTYVGPITIDFGASPQKGLFLIAQGNGNHVITKGLRVEDSRVVTISGFRIESPANDGEAAIVLRSSTAVALVDCTAKSGDDGGVDADGVFEVLLRRCSFSGMSKPTIGEGGYGARIIGRSCHTVIDCDFDDNEVEGLRIEADQTTVRRCRARNNGDANTGGGMVVEGLQNQVRDCSLKSNDGFGLSVVGVCDVRGNAVKANSKLGVRIGVDGGAVFTGGSVRSNKIKNNGGFGVLVKEAHEGLEIRANKIIHNVDAGVRLEGDRNAVGANLIRNSETGAGGGQGVLIASSSSRNCLAQNEFGGNDGAAVRVEGSDNYLVENLASGNDGFVDAGSDNDGRANKVASGTNDFP